MNNHITRQQVIDRLTENNLDFEELSLSGDKSIIITKYGGRVIGPFDSKTGECLMWLNKLFDMPDEFAARLADPSLRFNFGGERLWFGPELTFYTTDRYRFEETYHVQRDLDPGNYSVVKDAHGVSLGMYAKAQAHNMPFATKEFRVDRRVMPLANPLRSLKNYEELMQGVEYAGYDHIVTMEDLSAEKPMYLEPWFVMQVLPDGEAITPINGTFEFDDYYEPIDDTIQTVYDGFAVLQCSGRRHFKVGYKAAKTTGRMGYLVPIDEERHLLIIKNYYNDPSCPYCMEPWGQEGKTGCSFYIYNDYGTNQILGGEVEFEHCALTIGLDTNRTKSTTSTGHFFFVGSKDALSKIIYELLGVRY